MSMEDYKKEYGDETKKYCSHNLNNNSNYGTIWKLEEVWQQKKVRHWMNVWMCLSREGTIQGSVEARHYDTNEKLGEIYFCSINTTTTAEGSNRCNSGNKNKNRYKMQWNPANDIWLYRYNDKNDKWVFVRKY